jgi:succinoglycan biosynthesis protein ExoM
VNELPHLSVCICTYRRPHTLHRLLIDLSEQNSANEFTFSISVADNDAEQSARPIVEQVTAQSQVMIRYCSQPTKNIALARNTAIANSSGDFVAFIDDDEFPQRNWLLTLWRACEKFGVEGVLGPVLPKFETEPPLWVLAGGFYERPRHRTGFQMEWPECRTGNVLVRRRIFGELSGPFHKEFGTGGEDQDFFRRAMERGHRFIWCDQAAVYEWVPPSRWSRRFLLSRALLRGSNSLKHPRCRVRNIVKSIIAVPVYCLAMPILLVGQRRYLMKYCVKLMDHLGRILAVVSLNPVKRRPM